MQSPNHIPHCAIQYFPICDVFKVLSVVWIIYNESSKECFLEVDKIVPESETL